MQPAQELRKLIQSSTNQFSNISIESWERKNNPKKWSKKEILGHLIDSAMTNLRRFIVTQYKQNQKIVYDQDEWVAFQNYRQADIAEVISLFKLLNFQIARVIEQLPGEKLALTCDTGKQSVELHTLEFLINDYIEHLKHHLHQIFSS